MLQRARIWMGGGVVTGLFGFTGLLHTTAILAQTACYICAFFCLLSLLFSLFEAAPPAKAHRQYRPSQPFEALRHLRPLRLKHHA